MNSAPMTFLFCSGSATPLSFSRNLSAASTFITFMPRCSLKTRITCCASPFLRRPWSTKRQVSPSPHALCARMAHTAESTPPESAQSALLPESFSLRLSVSMAAKLAISQSPFAPHRSNRKRRTASRPSGVFTERLKSSKGTPSCKNLSACLFS